MGGGVLGALRLDVVGLPERKHRDASCDCLLIPVGASGCKMPNKRSLSRLP